MVTTAGEPAPPAQGDEGEAAAGTPDGTLGGYLRLHDRPPAFGGSDGHPYTVSIEVEQTAKLRAPFNAYLLFPRWAETGAGIVGHVETSTLAECHSREEAERRLGELTLFDVQRLLEETLVQQDDTDT